MIIQPVLIRIPFQPNLTGPQRVERQRRFARIALDRCAKLCGAPAGPWPQTPERVPIPRDGFHWSIAHKPRFAAAVIARIPVGIDIESITQRTRDLSTAVASPEEWVLMKPSRDPKVEDPQWRRTDEKNVSVDWRTFFEVWTAKEAVLKANSVGIGVLKQCLITGRDMPGRLTLSYAEKSWAVQFLEYAGHLACVTSGSDRVLWHVVGDQGLRQSYESPTA